MERLQLERVLEQHFFFILGAIFVSVGFSTSNFSVASSLEATVST